MRGIVVAVVLTALIAGASFAWYSGRSGQSSADSASPASTSSRTAPAEDKSVPESRLTASPHGPGPFQFTEVTEVSGVDFVHVSGDSSEKPFPAANGSGVATFDYDRDGSIDLLFLSGTELPVDPKRKEPRNRCYRNRGRWSFVDTTDLTGLGAHAFSAGIAIGDYDSDGFPDVYVNCYGSNFLYRNCGDGTFVDVSAESGATDTAWGTGAAFLDYDGDGLLDIYVCNYAHWDPESNQWCGNRASNIRIFCDPTSVEADRGSLYRNLGDGRFEDCLDVAGLGTRLGRGQGVVATDVNRDGWIDLYITNDLHPNFLYLNEGNGTFRDFSEESGTAHDYAGRNQAGMGVDAADINGDGLPELFVTNYEGEHNAYYESMGGGLYQELSRPRGLAAESIPEVGWGTAFVDFDQDGLLDVVVTNGHTDTNLSRLGRESRFLQAPGLWRNNGQRFEWAGGAAAGEYFGSLHPGRGLAVADLDNDGDSDLAIVHQDLPPALLRNDNSTKTTRSVLLCFVGTSGNRDAVGIEYVFTGAAGTRVGQVKGGGSYLSASDRRQSITLPAGTRECELEVRWGPGNVRRYVIPPAGLEFVVVESREAPTRLN